jgi:hypothetical protein
VLHPRFGPAQVIKMAIGQIAERIPFYPAVSYGVFSGCPPSNAIGQLWAAYECFTCDGKKQG